MEFESHLKFKRDVRYQSVRRGRQRKKGKSALYERNYSAGVWGFIQSFLVIGVSVQKEKNTRNTHLSLSRSHPLVKKKKRERDRASKGNYILVSKSRQQLELKAQKNTVQPIPHYFRRQRCEASFSNSPSVWVCHSAGVCIGVCLCVYRRVRRRHCILVFAYCLLTCLRQEPLHFREQRQCLQLQRISFGWCIVMAADLDRCC